LVFAIVLIASGGGDKATTTVRKGPVALTFEDPWDSQRPAAVVSQGLRFRDPIALRDRSGTLIAGQLVNGSLVPGGIPPAFSDRLDGEPSRTTLRLGGTTAVRYRGKSQDGPTTTLFVVATESRDIALACFDRTGRQDCWAVAETLRVVGEKAVPPGADPALAERLAAIMRPLETARSASTNQLVAAVPKRAEGAARIARTATQATKSLERVSSPPRNRGAVAALAEAVEREARSAASMARAARRRDRDDYRQATRAAMRAERAVRLALARLRHMGFTALPVLDRIELPPLPEPAPESVELAPPMTSVEAAPTYVPPPSSPAPSPSPPPQPVISAPK
jgi:hypothetical protein